jgi:hypothetical protein
LPRRRFRQPSIASIAQPRRHAQSKIDSTFTARHVEASASAITSIGPRTIAFP